MNIINQTPFLRTSREFPENIHMMAVEVTRTYLDVATAVNNRTIGLYPVNRAAQTGNGYFFTNQRQNSFRQVYVVPAGITTGSTINVGFKFSTISQFSPNCYGTYTDGTNWYGLIFASNGATIPGQVSFYLAVNGASTTSDQIVFEVDAAAPTVSSGTVSLEWITFV